MFETHVWAIVVSAVLSMIAGYFWYHETAFGAVWREAHGCKEDEKSSLLQFVGGFLNTLVVAWVFCSLLAFFGVATLVGAITTAFWCWLGFIATTQFSGVIWCKKPLKSYFIDVGFFLVMMVIIAIAYGILG